MENKTFQVRVPCDLLRYPSRFREKRGRGRLHFNLVFNMLRGMLKFLLCPSHAPRLNQHSSFCLVPTAYFGLHSPRLRPPDELVKLQSHPHLQAVAEDPLGKAARRQLVEYG